MIRAVLMVLAILSATAFATFTTSASPKPGEIALRAGHQLATEPLTVEKIAELDPGQPNPQLRRWVVARKVDIQGWKTRKVPGGLVGVAGGALQGDATIYLRSSGPWYNTTSQFPCGAKAPDPVFATEMGTKVVAERAAELWDEMLSENRLKLSFLLSKVAAVNEKSVWIKANRVFQEWLHKLDHDWRAQVAHELVPEQWKKERKLAEASGVCRSLKKAKETSPEAWMAEEGQAPVPSPVSLPLAHAPSRRWHGLFAVRMDVGVGDSSVLGQMLVDPATPKSILSPDWMKGQGLLPEWIEVPEAQPERAEMIAGVGQSGLAKVVQVDRTRLSGLKLSLDRFLLFNSALFDEPEYAAPCCSGVLGSDFLRRYVVEFRGKKPFSVQLWSPRDYHPPEGFQWVEVRETTGSKGQVQLVPQCTDRVKALQKVNPGAKKLCQDPRLSLEDLSDQMVFDLPHGRVWYSPAELSAPEYRNTSGLRAVFTFHKGDRVLEVKSIEPNSAAASLQKAGLKPGMVITEIDGFPTLEMDQWEVQRRLSGVYGSVIHLKWNTPKGVHAEPLRVFEQVIRQ